MRRAVDVETTRDVQQQTHSTYRVHGHDQTTTTTTTTWFFSSACVSPEGGRARNAAQRSAMRPTRRARESLWRNKFVPPGAQCRSSCTARRDEDDSCKVPDAREQRVETKVDWGEFGSSQPAKNGAATQKWRGGFPVRCLLSEKVIVWFGFVGPASEREVSLEMRRWRWCGDGGRMELPGRDRGMEDGRS